MAGINVRLVAKTILSSNSLIYLNVLLDAYVPRARRTCFKGSVLS